ncbi:hypothetical protein [Citreimonas sp.]|uniref:hypothetical protein n=1 Tax=Citreimonas sp. TaxID=3036715 RepID=UPI004058B70B
MSWLLIFFVVEAGTLQPVNDLEHPFGAFPTLDRCMAAGSAIELVARAVPDAVDITFQCERAGVPT